VSSPQLLFQSNFAASQQRINKLTISLAKTQHLFPLTIPLMHGLSDEMEEAVDALILRYSQCVSMIQDQLFRGIALIEQEDLSDKSNRDKALLMEKLGAIKSADDFGTAAVLRNRFSHHYPEEAGARIERLNLVVMESQFVLETFATLTLFAQRKGYL
jgi:hypothetical protein